MPVNIPFDKPVSQDLYAGTSEEQVDALTDLLMHFDTFAKRNLSLDAYLRQQPPASPSAGPVPVAPSPPEAAAPPAPTPPRASSDSRRPPVALR
jgi:hypothetical protein